MKHDKSAKSNFAEYIKFAFVLIAIFATANAAYFLTPASGAYEFMQIFMGVFLIVFASFKFIGYKMFVMMFANYDLIAKRSKVYTYAYPFIEFGLGVLYLGGWFPLPRNFILLLIMSIGAIGVFQEIYHRRSGIYCACLGNVIKLPLSTVSLVENISMATMALIMLVGTNF